MELLDLLIMMELMFRGMVQPMCFWNYFSHGYQCFRMVAFQMWKGVCCLQDKEAFMKFRRISNGLCGYVWLPLRMALNLLCIFINRLWRWTTSEKLVKMDSMKILTKLLVHFLLMFVCMDKVTKFWLEKVNETSKRKARRNFFEIRSGDLEL